ncbi:MAG: hypothetical protein JXR37_33225 [Kiritimatiellae bacterium]|nr:hypothetical protein [Kiritimatiellia bacterium]
MTNEDRIQPYVKNPRYWQYKGEPVLLLGGSKTDHIFLADELEAHLDEMVEVGANFVRCTMSQREPIEMKPHKLLPDKTFDLEQWNEEYWARFEKMLGWTAERDIFVQIEVWDRFDVSGSHWQDSPWNPGRNVNYSYEETGFAEEYPDPPGKDKQPFFHSIPGMPNYDAKLDLIRGYQERFVAKILSYSLDCGHVLYCMDNETSTPAPWGQYWMKFIKDRAAEKGVNVYTTDMFDDGWKGEEAEHIPVLFDHPDEYTFADISQVNSRNFHELHWQRMQWLIENVCRHPRPVNNVKIYGGGYARFGTGGNEDGIHRFLRNVIGGCAGVRFHRPRSGNGLNERAKAIIAATRKLESAIKMWDVEPHMELLIDCEPNQAYVAAKPGEQYAVYLPNGGGAKLDLRGVEGSFDLKWISVTEGEWVPQRRATVEGGDVVAIGPCYYDLQTYRRTETGPAYGGGWIAVVTRGEG